MILMNKKRIFILLSLIIIVTIVSSMKISINQHNTIPTVALPVSNKTVIIDAGHRSEKMVVQ